MTSQVAAARILALPRFADIPALELDWLSARGEVREYDTGSVVREGGTPIDEMLVLLSGRASLYVPRGGGWRRVLEVMSGQVLGIVPYSRMKVAPGTLIIDETASVFVLHRKHFPDLIRDCPVMSAALVHQMVDRAREYRTVELQDARLQSLGKLASGLAHELNNPASAASRNAQALETLLAEAENAARALAAAPLSEAQLEAVDEVRAMAMAAAPTRSALEAADREDEISDWLERHGIDAAAAESLAISAVTLAALDRLAAAIPASSLAAAIRWVAAGRGARDAAAQIASATGRIHDLVDAVKGFTFMDHEAVPEEVDIARGLADTVVMLEGKWRARAVHVLVETADNLPRVYGYGSEINQVWEKLIDNAIDAAGSPGTVTVTATSRGDAVVVRVMDGGPGISEELRARIFDPFFTTKPVGQGNGLGLDLARRFVHRHHGDIDFTSQPGRTVFRVRLPVSGAREARNLRTAGAES